MQKRQANLMNADFLGEIIYDNIKPARGSFTKYKPFGLNQTLF